MLQLRGIDIKLSANIPKRTKRASGVTIYRKEKKVCCLKCFSQEEIRLLIAQKSNRFKIQNVLKRDYFFSCELLSSSVFVYFEKKINQRK